MVLNEIFLTVLLISATALCIYLIITAKKLQKTLENTDATLSDFKNKVDPLIENLTSLSEKMVSISDEAEKQISEYGGLFDDIRERINSITSLKRIFRSGNSADSLTSTISGIRKGFSAFWSRLLK